MMRSALLILLGIISTVPGYAAEPWIGFRGPGDSIALAKDLPITWEQRGRSGWTTRINGYGQSSPVVWGKRVFVTSVSGDEKEILHVAAIDLAVGKSLWQKNFSATQKMKDSDTVSRGAPTGET
ncbi:MAG: Pyrrolo-quinoline quinone [Planctomycetaceae bacterium]|nr:Pyrrolo-quinoline quinone [Planctomycetaceae bacterium]